MLVTSPSKAALAPEKHRDALPNGFQEAGISYGVPARGNGISSK
jgi:hypothetical protein